MADRNADARRIARELVDELGSPHNFTVQLFLNHAKDIVIPDHVFIIDGKIKGLLRYAISTGGLALDPHWPSIDVSQTAESLFSQKAVDVDMHINQTVARHFASRVDPAVMFLPINLPGAAESASGGAAVTTKYFAKDGLFDVIGDLRSSKASGILLEYRAPIDGYHNLLRATFTPFLLVMEMKQGGIPLKDTQVPLKHRVSTNNTVSGATTGGSADVVDPLASSVNSGGKAIPLHGRYNPLHHRGPGAVDVPVPHSASSLVCDMLNALISKRQENGEFVERCVAYFVVVSPKQVLFLWCSQINAMPLEHALQLQEEVTSLAPQQQQQQKDEQQQQKKQSSVSSKNNNNNKSGAASPSSSPPRSPNKGRNTPASLNATRTGAVASSSKAASLNASRQQQKAQFQHPPLETSHHHYYEQKHDDSEFLSDSLVNEMDISRAAEHDQDISAHSAYVKEQSFILSGLPSGVTAMRDSKKYVSSLARVRDAYHSELSSAPSRNKQQKQQEQEQHESGSAATSKNTSSRASAPSSSQQSQQQQQRQEEVEEDDVDHQQSAVSKTGSSVSCKATSSAAPTTASDPAEVRNLAKAAAARHVAKLFGVRDKKLPPEPEELRHYSHAARDVSDYSATRTADAHAHSIQSLQREAKRERRQEDDKMQRAFERAEERRRMKEARARHQQHGSSDDDDESNDEHPHAQRRRFRGSDEQQQKQQQQSGAPPDSNASDDGATVETTAMSNAHFIAELPSAARAVKPMRDSEFDAQLQELHEPSQSKFDTGMAGYLLDMPAHFLFSKYVEQQRKESQRTGLLEELLEPGALRAQKRKERKLRDQPPLELEQGDGMSFLEKTVSSKLSGQLLSSQLMDRRNRRARQRAARGATTSPGSARSRSGGSPRRPGSGSRRRGRSSGGKGDDNKKKRRPSGPHHKKNVFSVGGGGGASSISDLLFHQSDGDETDSHDAEDGYFERIVAHHEYSQYQKEQEQQQQQQQRRGGSAGRRGPPPPRPLSGGALARSSGRKGSGRTTTSSSSRTRSRQNSGIFDIAGYFATRQESQERGEGRRQFLGGDDDEEDYFQDEEEDEQSVLYPSSALSAPAAGLSQDDMAKYTYTVRRIRALGQVIFQTAADLLYRAASQQHDRRQVLELVIPFGYRHLDQELRSVFHTLALEEQSLESMQRIAAFRDQHDADGTSFGELALNTQIGEAETMFEDESLVRQSNGTVTSVRDEWYSIEGGGSVVFLLRDAVISLPRVERRLVSLEAELTPLTRFDSPLCSPKDVACCLRMCELVAERGFTICDAANVVIVERDSTTTTTTGAKR